jgi:hypothetical protein
MIVASIRTAAASPTPSCCICSSLDIANIENTATMTIAALVTTPAVLLIP